MTGQSYTPLVPRSPKERAKRAASQHSMQAFVLHEAAGVLRQGMRRLRTCADHGSDLSHEVEILARMVDRVDNRRAKVMRAPGDRKPRQVSKRERAARSAEPCPLKGNGTDPVLCPSCGASASQSCPKQIRTGKAGHG